MEIVTMEYNYITFLTYFVLLDEGKAVTASTWVTG